MKSIPREVTPTNDIIAILVLHHELERAGTIAMQGRQLRYDGLPLSIRAELYALLHHVRRKLVLRQCQQLTLNDFDDLRAIFWFSVLDYMLSDIVAVLISYEHGSALVKLL